LSVLKKLTTDELDVKYIGKVIMSLSR